MVLLVLHVKAELENIESITFPPDIQYCFDVKDAQSDEEKKGVFLCADEIAEVDGSKGDANFAMRFPDCKKQCTVTFTDVKGVTRDTITAEDSGNFVPIRGSDCRGLELAKWTPTEGLVVKSTGGTKWENVDLGADPDGWFGILREVRRERGHHRTGVRDPNPQGQVESRTTASAVKARPTRARRTPSRRGHLRALAPRGESFVSRDSSTD